MNLATGSPFLMMFFLGLYEKPVGNCRVTTRWQHRGRTQRLQVCDKWRKEARTWLRQYWLRKVGKVPLKRCMYVNHSAGGSDTDGIYVALESNHHCSWKTNGKTEPLSHGLLYPLTCNWLSWRRGLLWCQKVKFYDDGTVEKKTLSALVPKKPPHKMRESELHFGVSTLKRGRADGTYDLNEANNMLWKC